jgi:D-alanyl-lipoteichoic acid acyltransferase DltB (MBOAT superfamily)
MPLGISFYVFKTLSYIFDLKREIIEQPEKNYINYLLYVSFFPNILAGPISKARNLLPQLNSNVIIDKTKAGNGLFLILCGTFKKIVIADMLGRNLVDRVFDAPEFFSNFETLMAGYGYTMQLYFDFSGYTDIVIGLALLLGFSIEPNFNKPFLAQNISEFWRRWHITLSSWLNEYIYQPLSFYFRKFKSAGVVLAVLITFTISGLWHGPALTYVIWGILHGLAITWDITTSKLRKKVSKIFNPKIYKFLSILICFHFLVFTMIIFRSENLSKSFLMLNKIFSGLEFNLILDWAKIYILPLSILLLSLILHYLPITLIDKIKKFYSNLHWSLKILVSFIVILIIFQAYNTDSQAFIYLKF